MLQQEVPLSVVPRPSATATQRPRRAAGSTLRGAPCSWTVYSRFLCHLPIPSFLLKLMNVGLKGEICLPTFSVPFTPPLPPVLLGILECGKGLEFGLIILQPDGKDRGQVP